MEPVGKGNKPLIRRAGRSSVASLCIPAILGPLRGLGFIIVIPFIGTAALILLGGLLFSRSLANLWRRSTQAVWPLEVTYGEPMVPRGFLQPLIDELKCELVVVGLDFRITQYCMPLSRRNKRLERAVIGQHCFEVTHGRNDPCDSRECECPVRKILETNDKVKVTHNHVNLLEDKGKKRVVNILASPIRDSQSNITQVAQLIWDADTAKQIVLNIQK